MAEKPLSAAVIGCGAAGAAAARQFDRCGISVTAVYDTVPRRARSLARQLRAACAVKSLADLRQPADILVLAVPDDAIGAVAGDLRRRPAVKKGALVCHLSGAVDADVFNVLPCNGLVMHPVYSFTTGQAGKPLPDGLVWELTGNAAAVRMGRRIVRMIKGKSVVLSSEDKVLSHIAGVISCNYLSVLAAESFDLAGKKGEVAQAGLMRQTLENVAELGPEGALTGPAARGDVKTVKKHIAMLRKKKKALVPLYCVLGRGAADMARRSGRISRYKAGRLRMIFKEAYGG